MWSRNSKNNQYLTNMNKKEKQDYFFWRKCLAESFSIRHKEILDNIKQCMKNDDQKRRYMPLFFHFREIVSKTIRKWLGVKNHKSYDSDLADLVKLAAKVKTLQERTKLLEGLLWTTYCWIWPTKDKVFNKHLDNIYNALQTCQVHPSSSKTDTK